MILPSGISPSTFEKLKEAGERGARLFQSAPDGAARDLALADTLREVALLNFNEFGYLGPVVFFLVGGRKPQTMMLDQSMFSTSARKDALAKAVTATALQCKARGILMINEVRMTSDMRLVGENTVEIAADAKWEDLLSASLEHRDHGLLVWQAKVSCIDGKPHADAWERQEMDTSVGRFATLLPTE